MNHIRIPAILKILEAGPMPSKDIADHMMMNVENALKYIRRCKVQNLVHIHSWDGQVPYYKLGPGLDAPKKQRSDEEILVYQRKKWQENKLKERRQQEESVERERRALESRQGTKATPWDALNPTLFRVAA
jgi:hypothetical protein